jgi:6-phosphogluconolactonase (cycloisomerase 2 family)
MAVVLGMSACGGYTVGFMWVLGTQYNQIAGYKIDDYTGNLTAMVNSPYPSAGTKPVSLAVQVGGNYVFVVNEGTFNASGISNGDGNVSVFAVGEDGVLTFLNSYSTAGNAPIWAVSSPTGSYLYVLDSQGPGYNINPANGPINLNGDVTVFGIDGSTGRLQLVPNQLAKNSAGQQLNYFPVGKVPTTMRASGQCLYTLDSGDQTVSPYAFGSNGQLVIEQSQTLPLGTVNATSISINGNNVYVTDAGSPLSSGGAVIPYTAGGGGCSLSVQANGAVANLPLSSNPVYSMTDSKNRFLYVLNHAGTNSNLPNSTISAYIIEATGQLQPVSDPDNPYPVGSGPVCMVQDPSGQYIYTSNQNDGTVTGKYINQNTGQLSDLTRGSSFSAFASGATCLAVSGNVD